MRHKEKLLLGLILGIGLVAVISYQSGKSQREELEEDAALWALHRLEELIEDRVRKRFES